MSGWYTDHDDTTTYERDGKPGMILKVEAGRYGWDWSITTTRGHVLACNTAGTRTSAQEAAMRAATKCEGQR